MLSQVKFIDEFLRDFCELHPDVLVLIYGGVQVKVLHVKGSKLYVLLGQHNVDHHLDKLKRFCGGGQVLWNTYVPSCQGDMRLFGVVLFGLVLTNYSGVLDAFLLVEGNIVVVNDAEGACPLYALLGRACYELSNSLAQLA